MSDETSIGSFAKFGSPCVKACVIQNGRCFVVAGGSKGFSRICSEVGVEHKKSEGMFNLLYWSLWSTLNCTTGKVYRVCCF